MRVLLTITISLCLSWSLCAQQSGLIDYPELGVKFKVPEGWVGQESEVGFLMGSNSVPGLILIVSNSTQSMEQLHLDAKTGIHDQNGTSLDLVNLIQDINATTIGGLYTGTLEWQPAKAFVIGIYNANGYGATIMAATTTESFGEVHEEVCKEVANSVEFYPAVVPQSNENWSELLKNARLTYMDSYYTSGGSYGDSGNSSYGGYSSKAVIDLCAQGYFNHSQSSSISYDAGAASVGTADQKAGAGTWKVVQNPVGQSILQLTFYNNEVYEYVISMEDDKTFLDGSRYYRTYGEYRDDGPDCR